MFESRKKTHEKAKSFSFLEFEMLETGETEMAIGKINSNLVAQHLQMVKNLN